MTLFKPGGLTKRNFSLLKALGNLSEKEVLKDPCQSKKDKFGHKPRRTCEGKADISTNLSCVAHCVFK
jgi:hypothetical protein